MSIPNTCEADLPALGDVASADFCRALQLITEKLEPSWLDYEPVFSLFVLTGTWVVLIATVWVARRSYQVAQENNIAAMRQAEAVARRKATLDMIEKVESAPHYIKQSSAFSQHRKKHTLSTLSEPMTSRDEEDRRAVLGHLSHYELVSVGIENGILDEEFYRSWMESSFIRDFKEAADFIQRERWVYSKENGWSYHKSFFEFYQIYANKWAEIEIDLTEETSGPPGRPSGPGDDAPPESKHD